MTDSAPVLVATEDIYVSAGVCAHRAGDRVPADNALANGWEDKVAYRVDEPEAPAELDLDYSV